MDWTHFLEALIGSGLVMGITDWFFFGVLFHDKYLVYPEVWRGEAGKPETKNIVIVSLLNFLTSFMFLMSYVHFDMHGIHQAMGLAIHSWLMIAVPLIISNALYMKFHSSLVISHSLGWLAKMVIVALAAGWLLS